MLKTVFLEINSGEQGCATPLLVRLEHVSLRLAADHLVEREQNNRTQQGHQQGGKGDRIIDRADPQQRGDEPAGQEGANNAHHDIKKQALL